MSKLERLTHLAIVTVCLGGIALVIGVRHLRDQAPQSSNEKSAHSLKLPGVAWQAASVNVVLQLSPTCHFCMESMPFYRRLVSSRHAVGEVAIIVASEAPTEAMASALAQNNVVFDRIVRIEAEALGSPGTPTLWVVSSKGVIERRYIGELDSSSEEEVLSLIKSRDAL